jgi:hypothetical protein
MKRFEKAATIAAALVVSMSASVAVSQTAFAQGSSDPQQSGTAQQGGTTSATVPSVSVTTDGTTTTTTGNPPTADQGATPPPAQPPASVPKKLLWRGTTLTVDQSVTSETLGVGQDYQSNNPSYQLWLSFRPRVYLFSDSLPKGHSFNVNGRIDMYKEMTNADDTTKHRENYLGDIWLTGAYSIRLTDSKKYPTTFGFGPRVLLPTSAASRGAGTYITAGGGASIAQSIALASGDYFSETHVALIGYYTHPFTPATTAVYDDLNRDRIQADGRTGRDNQLSGGYLVNHQLLSILDAGLQLTPKAGFSADLIFLHQWRHGAQSSGGCDGGGAAIQTQTGVRCAGTAELNGSAQTLRVSAFPVVSFDYQVLDELNLAIGYYTFTNTLKPDGTRRNFIYAPDSSRFFLTATISLDQVYKAIIGSETQEGAAVQGRLSRRQQMLQNITSF